MRNQASGTTLKQKVEVDQETKIAVSGFLVL